MPSNESGSGNTKMSVWWHTHVDQQSVVSPGDGSVMDPYSVTRFNMLYRSPLRQRVMVPGETFIAHNALTDARFNLLMFGVQGGGNLKCKIEVGEPTTPGSTTDYSIDAGTLETLWLPRMSCVAPRFFDDFNGYLSNGTTAAYLARVYFINDGAEDVTLLIGAVAGTEE